MGCRWISLSWLNTSALFFFFSLFPPQWGPIAQKKERANTGAPGGKPQRAVNYSRNQRSDSWWGSGILIWWHGVGMAGRGMRYGRMDREGAWMIEGSFRKIGQGFYLFRHSSASRSASMKWRLQWTRYQGNLLPSMLVIVIRPVTRQREILQDSSEKNVCRWGHCEICQTIYD